MRPWIVDLGASNNMTRDASLLLNLKACQGHNVKIADELVSKVTGIGSIKISNSLTLKSIFLVSNLYCNL